MEREANPTEILRDSNGREFKVGSTTRLSEKSRNDLSPPRGYPNARAVVTKIEGGMVYIKFTEFSDEDWAQATKIAGSSPDLEVPLPPDYLIIEERPN